ncbi:MAG: hypothetical protein HZA88_00290 [Verrucomicrobia bacterium]|nr:hypothetical protein [Verrucomicrobiota bacterium]
MRSGRIADHFWYDLDEEPLRDALRRIAPHILGLKAVNTSWDSGVLTSDRADFPLGWTTHNNVAVSPQITQDLIARWPLSHDECCDEWWFFKEIPSEFDFTHGICNHIANRIGDWADLEFEGGVQLARNISRFRPTIIMGYGRFTYCVSESRIADLEVEPAG